MTGYTAGLATSQALVHGANSSSAAVARGPSRRPGGSKGARQTARDQPQGPGALCGKAHRG